MSNEAPDRPALRYFGGKWMLAPWIISHFPAHRVYCEPFGGGASVLLRKSRAYAEIYNDLSACVVNFFKVLRDDGAHFERVVRLTPYARDEFDLAYDVTTDPVERARRFLIRSFMGFGSNGHSMTTKTGFRANANRSNTTPAQDWINWPDQIGILTSRLRGVVLENKPAIEVMAQQDSSETLFYVDPPYVHETRGRPNRYDHEMTTAQHRELCDNLQGLKGMVILSGYDHDLYERLKWKCVRRHALADGARERVEVLWLNERAFAAQTQMQFNLG